MLPYYRFQQYMRSLLACRMILSLREHGQKDAWIGNLGGQISTSPFNVGTLVFGQAVTATREGDVNFNDHLN